MARRRYAGGQTTQAVGALGGGWGGAVLNILFTVFMIAIVFGVLLDAVVVTNTTLAGTTGSNVAIGTTGSTPISVFVSLISYIVTLANFVGIIILLAIIAVVILVLYFFFRPGGGMGAATGM